jgi:hypothetical protein
VLGLDSRRDDRGSYRNSSISSQDATRTHRQGKIVIEPCGGDWVKLSRFANSTQA